MSVAVLTILALGAHVLFTLFLRGVARFFQDGATVDYITSYLQFWAVTAAAGLLVAGLALAGVVSGAGLLLLQVPLIVLGVVQVLWFARAVAGARDSIRVSVAEPG
jgi:hypothetical protein